MWRCSPYLCSCAGVHVPVSSTHPHHSHFHALPHPAPSPPPPRTARAAVPTSFSSAPLGCFALLFLAWVAVRCRLEVGMIIALPAVHTSTRLVSALVSRCVSALLLCSTLLFTRRSLWT